MKKLFICILLFSIFLSTFASCDHTASSSSSSLIESKEQTEEYTNTTPTLDSTQSSSIDTSVNTTNTTTVETTVETTIETTVDTTVETTVETTVDTTIDTTAEPTAETALDTTIETAIDTTLDTTSDTIADTAANTTVATDISTNIDTSVDITESTDQEDEEDSGNASSAPLMEELDLSSASSIDGIGISDDPTDYVLIKVTNFGSILIRLFPDVAPETVENFKALVSDKFYDGTIFHRVINCFMIQGGDPEGTGAGGSDKTIKGEFESNGFENNLSHLRGVVSMARSLGDADSASSQFFIMQADRPSLDGDYASFGYVVYGMKTVDKIVKSMVNANGRPLFDVVMSSVSFADISGINFDIETNIN